MNARRRSRQATDALMGAAYGSAGERCMAVSIAVAVGGVGDKVLAKPVPRVRALKVDSAPTPKLRWGRSSPASISPRCAPMSISASRKGQSWWSTAAA
jgi:hypothetical protein